MITKSKKAKGTVFYVPTITKEGQSFIGLLKSYVNSGEYKILIRGRNDDRAGVAKAAGLGPRSFHQDVPLENATYVAVYVDGKTTTRIANKWLQMQRQSFYDKIDKQRDEIDRLVRRKTELELKVMTQASMLKAADKLVEDARIDADFAQRYLEEAKIPTWSRVWADIKVLLKARWHGTCAEMVQGVKNGN